jgi:hypothetical protein
LDKVAYLEIIITGDICLEDVDVFAVTQLLRYLLFGGRFVSNEADDGIVGIAGSLTKYLVLMRKSVSTSQARTGQHSNELTPNPLEVPVIT